MRTRAVQWPGAVYQWRRRRWAWRLCLEERAELRERIFAGELLPMTASGVARQIQRAGKGRTVSGARPSPERPPAPATSACSLGAFVLGGHVGFGAMRCIVVPRRLLGELGRALAQIHGQLVLFLLPLPPLLFLVFGVGAGTHGHLSHPPPRTGRGSMVSECAGRAARHQRPGGGAGRGGGTDLGLLAEEQVHVLRCHWRGIVIASVGTGPLALQGVQALLLLLRERRLGAMHNGPVSLCCRRGRGPRFWAGAHCLPLVVRG